MKKEVFIGGIAILIVIIVAVYSILYYNILGTSNKKDEIVVGLYIGSGTWKDGIYALKLFFSNYNIGHKELDSNDIRNNNLSGIDILIIPGGWSWDYHKVLGATGETSIKNFVDNGGTIIGICAGAYYLSKRIIWEGRLYTYSLKLINVTAMGPKEGYPWPTSGIVNITLATELACSLDRKVVKALYYGGPEFIEVGSDVAILAYYADDLKPAIVMGKYGKGTVVLIGVHLEMREDAWPLLLALMKISYKNTSLYAINTLMTTNIIYQKDLLFLSENLKLVNLMINSLTNFMFP